MPTGACGINCDVCRLNLNGVCSSCGGGRSDIGADKLAVQIRIIGYPCPILACARLNQLNYCLCDCAQFPCTNFESGPHPFSRSFLSMQQRRLHQCPPAYAPDGSHLKVADEYWQKLEQKDLTTLCNLTMFAQVNDYCLEFQFLRENIRVDIDKRKLLRQKNGQWSPSEDPLLTLTTVVYLKNINQIYPLGHDIVGIRDLKEGHFFIGPHELRLNPLIGRYGDDMPAFRHAAEKMGGVAQNMADMSYRLLPFPRVALYFLLWRADAEFKARIQVLMDRSIENFLPADAIWALINRVTMAF